MIKFIYNGKMIFIVAKKKEKQFQAALISLLPFTAALDLV